MKVLHYSDHGSTDFMSLYKECDVLFTTGDLNYTDLVYLQYCNDEKPRFGVYGNHDSGNYMDNFQIINVHNKVVEFNSIKIGGFEGCLKYKDTGILFEEKDAEEFYLHFPAVDILLLHAGPEGFLDDGNDPVHKGSTFIRKYVIKKNPRFVFCGHQYSHAEMKCGNTQIFRTYGARIIDIPFWN
jgi:Icc-related predicted phosphoesterase